MRRIIYIAIFSSSIYDGIGQNMKLFRNLSTLETRGDILFEQSDYENAAILYEKAFKKDTTKLNLALKSGECYRYLNDYQNAELWYGMGITHENKDPEYILHYAQILITNKKYNNAKLWLSRYDSLQSNDGRAQKKLSSINNIQHHFKDSLSIEIYPLSINTENVEFGPAYFGSGIVFLSDRHSSHISNVMNWNVDEYTNIYYTEERENGSMTMPVEFHKDLKSNYHEGPLIFYGDNKVIFTRTGVQNKKTKESHLELYSADFDSKKNNWTNVTPLPFNNENYSVGHPAISTNGSTLYFTSNMPGGRGGTDLYVSQMINGEWTNPKNLGEPVNTKGNEMFPFLPNNQELVFASNGHGGLGDLDLFRVDLSGGSLENLGYPFNSTHADFGYISDSSGTKGYFTSNRSNGGLNDDIYQFIVKWSKVEVSVLNRTSSDPLSETKVEMIVGGAIKDVQFTDSNGGADFLTLPSEQVILEFSKSGYLPETKLIEIDENSAGSLVEIVVELQKIPKKTVASKPKDSYQELQDLYNQKKAMIQVNGRIFEYREIGNYQYLVNADEKILLSKDPPNEELTIEERAEVAVESKGLTMDGSYFIRNIYFDLNSVEISDSARIELNKVVKIMNVDKKVAFEINSYADSRGSMAYNDELSFKRSQNIARYLMANDVPGARLIIDSYGEQGLLNDCNDKKECDEIFHAVNRRAEFKLILRKLYK